MIEIRGDRNEPIIKAIMDLSKEQRDELRKAVRVIPFDGYPLVIFDTEQEAAQ